VLPDPFVSLEEYMSRTGTEDLWTTFRYDTTDFPFAEVVSHILEEPNLDSLPAAPERATREQDQATQFHKVFYSRLETFLPLYESFLRKVLGSQLDTHFAQAVPTFRVHLPGSVAVGEWHRDRDYGHDETELNYWVPLTPTFPENTLWIEDQPVIVTYGDVVVFRGAELRHGNVTNSTERSRVSFDFRTIPQRAVPPSADEAPSSVNFGLPFALGGYWTKIQS
jgi:ectoine hydroxylase-related dioxygenase (phytanoyl-CoA dioxygenase family)